MLSYFPRSEDAFCTRIQLYARNFCMQSVFSREQEPHSAIDCRDSIIILLTLNCEYL